MMKQFLTIITVMTATLMLINSCAHREPKQKSPEWVWKGSGAFDIDGGKFFHGIGAASEIPNQKLVITTAENRARAEIAKIIETYVAVLHKDYMVSFPADDMSTSSEQISVSWITNSMSKAALHNATIVDHWMDTNNKSFFALCKLDLAAFKGALDDLEELDSKLREYVRNNAEKIHEDLQKMENQ